MQKPGEILIPAAKIAERVRALGEELTRAYEGREPVLVAIMNGCVLFLADLVRAWPVAMDIEFVAARSYEGTRPGDLTLALPERLDRVIPGRPVVIIDDIFDTGRTLAAVCEAVRALGPEDLRTIVMLRKRRPRSPEVPPECEPDWVGFEVDDRFVVGYGLDCGGRFRNLPHVAALDASP